MPDSCLLRRFCLLSIAQFCVLKILQNSNFDCQMKEHERISYGSSTFLEINILTSIFLGAAYTELQFLLPPAPSDHPAHPPEVQIPDNWNEHPVAHPTWLPAFPKALRCTTGVCAHPTLAVAGGNDLIQWILLENVFKGIQNSFESQHNGPPASNRYCSCENCFHNL